MKKLIASALLLVTLVIAPSALSAGVNWKTNFKEAEAEAKAQNKPMLLLFTGSDWCGWCMKLENEVFDKPEFSRLAGNKYIFVKLDFPMRASQAAAEKKQNEGLRDRFGVSGFPTVILLSPTGAKLGETGYQKGGPKAFADYLNGLIGVAERLEGSLEGLASAQLEEHYRQAVDLGRVAVAKSVMEKGLEVSSGSFFLAEHYRDLVQAEGVGGAEAQAVRSQLLERDADNAEGRHLFVAVLDFQERLKGECTVEEASEPLIAYLEGIGKEDENRWRVEMTLAQFLRSRGEEKRAVFFAERSYASAPEEARDRVRQALSSFGIS